MAPVREDFSDVAEVARKLLDPAADGATRRMAAALRDLALAAFSSDGLLDYIEALWRAYASLQRTSGTFQRPTGANIWRNSAPAGRSSKCAKH